MPDIKLYKDLVYESWRTSLIKLECSEVELVKIKSCPQLKYANKYSPIDITSITTVKELHIPERGGKFTILHKVYFKEVDSESNEAIEFAEWILNKAFNKNRGIWNNNITKGALTTKELYEIFKNK